MKTKLKKKCYTCARSYRDRWANKNILLVLEDPETKELSSMELVFEDHNFKHLTGLKTKSGRDSKFFYRSALRKDLSQFKLSYTAFTKSKLIALENLSRDLKSFRIVGSYNGNGDYLEANKILGNERHFLALRENKNTGDRVFYYPASSYKADARAYIKRGSQKRVVYIFTKYKNQKRYTRVREINPAYPIDKLPKNIRLRLDLSYFT